MLPDYLTNYSELDLMLRFPFPADPEPVFLDVGAFRGGFTRAFAKRGWRVLAFEPDARNYDLCVRRNQQYPRVSCINKAVSENTGVFRYLYVTENHPARNSIVQTGSIQKRGDLVETIRLDDAVEEYGLDRVNLLKIDTEGADFICLKTFNFSRYRPELVMVEFYDRRSLPHLGYTHHDMVAFLVPYGYRAYVSELGPLDWTGSPRQIGVSEYKFEEISAYPLDHEPEHGNLIFVKDTLVDPFESTRKEYLSDLKRYRSFRVPINLLRNLFVRIPFSMETYYLLRRLFL